MANPVVEFVSMAWSNAGGNPHSWQAFNSQVRLTVKIALEGFEWMEGDVEAVLSLRNRRYSIAKCIGEGGIEWMYSTAVRAGNVSAYTELERHMKRTPLIADNVNGRQRDRLCVGSRFVWDGENVEVTSFDDQGCAVCVSRTRDWLPVKTGGKRYRISRKDIVEERKRKR